MQSEGHASIKAQKASGEYRLIDPLDYIILGYLNPIGEMFAGLYPLAHTALQIQREALQDHITMQVLASRLSTLHKMELIEGLVTPGSGGKNSYQRTPEGSKVLEKWRATKETEKTEEES